MAAETTTLESYRENLHTQTFSIESPKVRLQHTSTVLPHSIKPQIVKYGKALAVDLRHIFPDAKVFSLSTDFFKYHSSNYLQVAGRGFAHMTLLWHKRGFSDGQLTEVQEFVSQYYEGKPLTFTLSRWGERSDLIHGDLERFYQHLVRQFRTEEWYPGWEERIRPAHVELYCFPHGSRHSVSKEDQITKLEVKRDHIVCQIAKIDADLARLV